MKLMTGYNGFHNAWTVVLSDMASQEDVARLDNLMQVAPYVNGYYLLLA